MKLPLYERVALLKDVPDQNLKKGDIVTTVEFLEARHQLPNAYVVEVFNAIGETIAVFTVNEDDLEALTGHDVLHVRSIIQPTQTIQIFDEAETTAADEPLQKTEQASTSILVELPDELLKQRGLSVADAKLQLALALFQDDFFSLGKASEFADLHPSQFQKELAKRQIAVHYDVEDYRHDLDTLDNYTKSSHSFQRV